MRILIFAVALTVVSWRTNTCASQEAPRREAYLLHKTLDEPRTYAALYDTAVVAGKDLCEKFLEKKCPAPAWVRYYLGLYLFELGEREPALVQFQEAEKDSGELAPICAAWRQACAWRRAPSKDEVQSLVKRSSASPWAASEIGRIFAEFGVAPDSAVELCEQALPEAGGRRNIVLRNLVVVRTAREEYDRAMQVLGEIDCSRPEVEVDLGTIRLKTGDLPVILPLFDPVLLRCRARCQLLCTASKRGSDDACERLNAAVALDLLGKSEEAIPLLRDLTRIDDRGELVRIAAFARLAKIHAQAGNISQAQQCWKECERHAELLVEAFVDISPDRLKPVMDDVIACWQRWIRKEKEREQDISERRFRKTHKKGMWGVGQLRFLCAEDLAYDGLISKARGEYFAASVVGDDLFDVSERGNLEASGRPFVAQLGRLWLSMGRWINKDYYHDMCRYLYPPDGMLVGAYPECRQIRELVRTLYAFCSFDEPPEPPADSVVRPDFRDVIYGPAKPAAPPPVAERHYYAWCAAGLIGAVIALCGVAVGVRRIRRRPL